MLSAGPIRTDPRPTPDDERDAEGQRRPTTATMPGRPAEPAGDADRSDLVGQDPG